jgi:hypothetical protein
MPSAGAANGIGQPVRRKDAAVPVLAGRAAALGFDREFADKMPNGIDYELRKLQYDVALQANRPALAALFAYVPTSQVLLGSDFPFGTSADGIRGLEEYDWLSSPAPTTLRTGSCPLRIMRGSWSRPIWLCAFAALIRSHPRIGRYQSKKRVSSAKA